MVNKDIPFDYGWIKIRCAGRCPIVINKVFEQYLCVRVLLICPVDRPWELANQTKTELPVNTWLLSRCRRLLWSCHRHHQSTHHHPLKLSPSPSSPTRSVINNIIALWSPLSLCQRRCEGKQSCYISPTSQMFRVKHRILGFSKIVTIWLLANKRKRMQKHFWVKCKPLHFRRMWINY